MMNKPNQSKRPKPDLDLPRELLVDIFTRLPAKSLMRFMSISHDWHNTISHPHFAKWHFETVSEKTHRLLVSTNHGFMSLDYEDWSGDQNAVRSLGFPFGSKRFFRILGTCNGLVCSAFDYFKNFFIWNPTSSEHRELPGPGISLDGFECKYGFGFDASSNDYKIVLVLAVSRVSQALRLDEIYSFTEVNVFSLKTNSWRRWEVHDSSFPYDKVKIHGLCHLGSVCNGAIHWLYDWIDEQVHKSGLFAFDLAAEKFRDLPMPAINGERNFSGSVGVLEGKLCLDCIVKNLFSIEIWVMQEYGVRESWTPLILIPSNDQHLFYTDMFTPSCYSSSGDIIGLNSRYGLVKFNRDEKKLKHFPLCRGWYRREAVIYMESLEPVTFG